MKKNLLLLVAVCVSLLSNKTYGQDEALVSDYKAFIERTFETEFNAMSETRKVDPFMANFSPTIVGTIVNIGLDGKGKTETITSENLRNGLLRLVGKGSIKIKWDITEMTYTNVKGKTGVCGFLVTVTYFRDGEVIRELTNIGRIVSTKTRDSWQVTYFSLMSIEESVLRGSCYCDIYSQDDSHFLTQTYVPNGPEFIMTTDNVVVGKYQGKRYIRLNDDTVYYWNLNSGKITFEDVEIGTATGISLAIKIVLKHHNDDKCSSMKSRKSSGK